MAVASTNPQPPIQLSIKLVFFFSVFSLAVNVSHERQPPAAACPKVCRCGTAKMQITPHWRESPVVSGQAGGNLDVLTYNCSARDLKEVPLIANAAESPANALLLSDNKISHLDFAYLKRYPNLKMLVVNRNGLKSLSKPGDDYQPCYSLIHLDLSENQLHVLHAYVFAGFPALKTLNLSGNAIHTISGSAFSLPALETIDLSRNHLGVVQSSIFETSPKLTDILLSHNGISRLNEGTFGLLRYLNLLDLSHNSLMKLEDNVLVGMNITHLDLGFNSLRRVPGLALRKLTWARTIILDGNLFVTLEPGALHKIPVEFLSISQSPHLVRVEKSAVKDMTDLETLTLNNNKRLGYIHPDAVTDAPRLVALDLTSNSLYALEAGIAANLPQMRAVYLSGNNFHCHCSLKWLGSNRFRVLPDMEQVKCRPEGHLEPISLLELIDKFQDECEPYILPLFEPVEDELMGRNISWLCKALGSTDIELAWRLPQKGQVVRSGLCSERACLENENNMFTIRYLHPSDAGRYTCLAKNKYGQDQRQILLDVKSENIQIFPIAVASTFVTLSWNTSASLSTGRGYILRVRLDEDEEDNEQIGRYEERPRSKVLKQYEDIDVGLKMNSYTVNGLNPGISYLFELCLRKDIYVITISSAKLTTRYSGFEVALGIETDYVTLFAVAIILTSITITCVTVSGLRWWHYRIHMARIRNSDGGQTDSSSQREMILSPSDPSSLNYSNSCNYFTAPASTAAPATTTMTGASTTAANSKAVVNESMTKSMSSSLSTAASGSSLIVTTTDKSKLMEFEVSSPIDEMRESFA